jgi:hypothetical protein
MNNFWKTIIAGYGAKKLGGGCLSTIIIFIVIYYALGTCNSHPAQTKHAGTQLPTHSIAPAFYSKSKANLPIIAPGNYLVGIK